MKRIFRTISLPSLALFASLGITSCDSGGRADALGGATPLETAQQFVKAIAVKDTSLLEATFTKKAREGLRSGSGFDLTGEPLEDVRFGTPSQKSDAAQVPLSATRAGEHQDVTLHLRPEEGEWRIHAIEIGIAGSGSMTLDLERMGALAEQLAETMAQGMALAFEEAKRDHEQHELERRRTMFESLRSYTQKEFEKSWQVTRDLRGRSSIVAIELLAAELGLAVDFGTVASSLVVPVKEDFSGRSRIEAIEAIAAEVGCHPVFPAPSELEGVGGDAFARSMGKSLDGAFRSEASAQSFQGDNSPSVPTRSPAPGAIRIEPGSPEPGFTHEGPFRMSVESVTQRPRYATGSVQVLANGYGFDPALAGAGTSVDEVITFTEVVDDRGRELRENPDVHYLGSSTIIRGAAENRTSIDLKGLLRDVPRIARIGGIQRLVIPTRVESIELAALVPGGSGKAGKLRYKIGDVGAATTIQFTGPDEILEALTVLGRPYDSAGSDMAVAYDSTSSWGNREAVYQIQCETAPARLDLKVITAREVLEFPFLIEGIGLPQADEAPASLPTLEFAGHDAPVEVRFVELKDASGGFPQVLLSISNHSNKDAATITARFEYLDRAGGKLEQFPHTLSGPGSFDGPQPVVEAGRDARNETAAFFLPEGTKSVRVALESVEFMDATSWKNPTAK